MIHRFPGPGIDRFTGPGWDTPWWHGFLGWIVPLLFLLGIAALVVWAVLRVTERRHPAAAATWPAPPPARPADSAMDQARLRYARGEMSREDFLQISSDLQEGPTGREENR